MSEKAKEIAKLIDRDREEYPLPSLPETVTALPGNTHQQLATALTAYEGIMFSRIRPADYIDYLREYQGPNRVADACLTTLKISLWVKQRILRFEKIKTRAKAYRDFLKIAEGCYELRNFSAVAAIFDAFESDVIKCLEETLGELDAPDRRLRARLNDFLKIESSYRTALNSSEEPCVPRLDLHLRDLRAVFPSCLPSEQRTPQLINIMGCIAVASQLQEITKFRTPVVNASLDVDALPYLLNQLAAIEVGRAANDQLRLRGQALKASEKEEMELRQKGLEESGFTSRRFG